MRRRNFANWFLIVLPLLLLFTAALSNRAASFKQWEGASSAAAGPVYFPVVVGNTDRPASVGGMGILGDSNSDEYCADDRRGGAYAATTLNWMEQLVLRRELNFGPWGRWGEPRRTGYAYNWARTGATAASLIDSGQHTGLAQQVAAGEVSHVFIWIGGNDFAKWNGTYAEIYEGRLSDTALQAKVERIIANITTAVDTILKAGSATIVVATIPDKGLFPDIIAAFPDPAKRRRVTDAIYAVNAGLRAMAAARHIAIAEDQTLAARLLPQLNQNGILEVGGEPINVFAKGDEPHHGRLDDSVGHVGTVLSGLIANVFFIEPLNDHYGLRLEPLTEQEILENAGLAGDSRPCG
jgi:hypothetical protein